MGIGSLIKEKRLAFDMTLEDLALAINSSKSYIHEIENDKDIDIGFTKAIKLSIALNIPIGVLAAVHIGKGE